MLTRSRAHFSAAFRVCVVLLVAATFAATHPEGEGDQEHPEKPGGAKTEDSSEHFTTCHHCNEKGREKCPDCSGRGQLFEPCKRCSGSGRKPCPTCTKKDRNTGLAATTAGQVFCGACDGTGQIGQRSLRPCTKCGGAGMRKCSTCRGRGTLKCRTENFVGICPRCKFAGRVVCTHCDGTRRLRRKATKTAKKAAPKETPQNELLKLQDQPVGARFQRLARLNDQQRNLLGPASSEALTTVERGTARASRSLYGLREAEGTLKEVKTLRRSVTELRSRWESVRGASESFERTFRHCESTWLRSENAPTKKRLYDQWKTEWEKDLKLKLRICERRAEALAKLRPVEIAQETAALTPRWEELQAQVQTLVAESGKSDNEGHEGHEGHEEKPGGEKTSKSKPAKTSDSASRKKPKDSSKPETRDEPKERKKTKKPKKDKAEADDEDEKASSEKDESVESASSDSFGLKILVGVLFLAVIGLSGKIVLDKRAAQQHGPSRRRY